MTQEEKQLLLKDLCARLPYGVKGFIDGFGTVHIKGHANFVADDIAIEHNGDVSWIEVNYFKPYLRSMSSMTEEENAIFNNISNKDRGYEKDENGWIRCDSIHTKWGVWPDGCAKLLDYLNSIHIDYRGLILIGLALEAPEGMYKTK